ncbi:MAG: hypothetical protein QOD75_1800 [Blastocatellia bacterium]|jgi:peptidoglycan/LPS O-acetylase OafA/YrhL|nr:hypothetical protein [Blastocatellia bacterium]
MADDKKRIVVLDFLRGMAALAVVFHHFLGILNPGLLQSARYYGQLGVQVFFVISGFVIPYSLYRGQYALRNYGTFVLKRVTRLDPPYLVTIVVIILLGVFSWYFSFQQGEVFSVTVPQILLHFAYINVFFGYPWLADVFWTLAIEFQYYLLMGLVFPLLFSRKLWIRIPAMVGLGLMPFVITSPVFIFYFIYLFLMGILTCQYWIGFIGKREYAGLLVLSVALALLTTGVASTVAACLAVFAILFLKLDYALFRFLGSISYSLYLIHTPVGKRALNLFLRLTHAQSQAGKLLVVAMALAVTILAAYLLYRFVERPSQKWSASFRYHRRREPEVPRPEETEQFNPAF